MSFIIENFKFIQFFGSMNWAEIGLAAAQIAGGLVIILNILISLFLLIPGDAPEKQLKMVVDFLSKYSRK